MTTYTDMSDNNISILMNYASFQDTQYNPDPYVGSYFLSNTPVNYNDNNNFHLFFILMLPLMRIK